MPPSQRQGRDNNTCHQHRQINQLMHGDPEMFWSCRHLSICVKNMSVLYHASVTDHTVIMYVAIKARLSAKRVATQMGWNVSFCLYSFPSASSLFCIGHSQITERAMDDDKSCQCTTSADASQHIWGSILLIGGEGEWKMLRFCHNSCKSNSTFYYIWNSTHDTHC